MSGTCATWLLEEHVAFWHAAMASAYSKSTDSSLCAEEWGKTIRDLPPVASSVAQPPAQAADQPNVTVAFDLQLVGPDASVRPCVWPPSSYTACEDRSLCCLDVIQCNNCDQRLHL